MGPAAFEAGRLKCPDCGYILHNLPEWHTCPECGLDYDPHSRVHSVSRAGWYLHQLSLASMLGLLAVFGALPQIRAGAMQLRELLEFWGILGVISLPYIIGLIRCIGGPRRVLINHRGIRFEYPDARAMDVSWSQFGSSQVGFITKSLKVWDSNGRQLLRYRDRKIGTPRLRAKLAAEFNALAKVYALLRPDMKTKP